MENCWPRQPTPKHGAQQIAEQIQGWLPARATDPESQHETTQLRNQLAELRQRTGEDTNENTTPRSV
jgi:hypothetical protein